MPSNVIPDSHKHLLAQPILAHAATVGPKGEPQANPIWFLWDGQYIVISIGPEGQKARNLERNPRIALSMVDAENPLLYLEVRGTVASVLHVDSQDSTVIAMVRKYTGNDTYPGMPDQHSLFSIDPVRATTMG